MIRERDHVIVPTARTGFIEIADYGTVVQVASPEGQPNWHGVRVSDQYIPVQHHRFDAVPLDHGRHDEDRQHGDRNTC